MTWSLSTNFEDNLVDLQPELNSIQGQLAYEAASTYEYVDKMIEEAKAKSKAKDIADSLALMERIQQIAGTKPVGYRATMADWEDESTVEQEAIAMMRQFGMMSMAD